MAEKTIPLVAVRHVLHAMRFKDPATGKPFARWAAYTNSPEVNISCKQALWGHRPYRLPPLHFSPMTSGYMGSVLERVRSSGGLREVRRTFGAGLRAMQAEFANGVMR